MAMETVDAHLITQFNDMMHVKAQQMKSRLRPYVIIKKMTGNDFAYDGLGPVEARELTGRFNLTQFDDIEHFRRKLSRRRFSVTLPIDDMDVEGRLTDPQGDYAQQTVNAMERVFDRVCYDAMFADVQTGKDFSTTVTATADGVLTVDATGGFTYPKLLEIRRNFFDAEVGNDIPVEVAIGISGDENSTLLQINQLTSGDFTRQVAVDKGQIVTACGMNLVMFGASVVNPLLAVAGGVRTSFALSYGGLCVGLSRDWKITIKDRADYTDVKQVQITGVLGAVRTEGRRIQKLTTTDL